jgi:isopenicillin N synthase-like dioxygenase
MTIPILDLGLAEDPSQRNILLGQLRDALFNVGFLYIINHGVEEETILNLATRMPELFCLSDLDKNELSKLHSPHFLGYSSVAEEITQGKHDLREQFDFATELPVIYGSESSIQHSERDFASQYWRLRGPNQWPAESDLPGFKDALLK